MYEFCPVRWNEQGSSNLLVHVPGSWLLGCREAKEYTADNEPKHGENIHSISPNA